jgi:hypothetical protein
MKFLSAARLLLGLLLAANGIAMLAAPEIWYLRIPGVADTGPLNPHFIRDIGCAYLVTGGTFVWLWRDFERVWPAALAGSAFLMLHALVHIGEAAAGTLDLHHLARDLPGVFLLPILALWLAWPRSRTLPPKENFDAAMDSTASARRL